MANPIRPFTTASEAIGSLYRLRQFGTKLGLENPRRLAAFCGNPEKALRFVHVAGTNGKGSVCAFLEHIYRAEGYRVGLFTSPHLVHFGERIQVDRHRLGDAALVALVNRVQEALSGFPRDSHPTFFEVVVVMALLHFHQSHCDLVIWETGMGGRLDATNIVTPELSVITNIGRDHQRWLGDTLEAIALEKAGIIKSGVPLVHGLPPGEVCGVIEEVARNRKAPVSAVAGDAVDQAIAGRELGLQGRHQRQNAALAIAAVAQLQKRFPVSETALSAGLAGTNWPGRLEKISLKGRPVLLDGAHNEDSMNALCDELESRCREQRCGFVLGVLEDKAVEEWLPRVVERARWMRLVPVQSGRSLNPEGLARLIRGIDSSLPVQTYESLEAGLDGIGQEAGPIVICGSIYLIGEVHAQLDQRGQAPGHAALNDWGVARSPGNR